MLENVTKADLVANRFYDVNGQIGSYTVSWNLSNLASSLCDELNGTRDVWIHRSFRFDYAVKNLKSIAS